MTDMFEFLNAKNSAAGGGSSGGGANRAALIELVDEGTKNKLKNTAYTREVNGVSYTVNADGSVAITSDGTNTLSQLYLTRDDTSLSAGEYVLSGAPGGSTTTYDIRVKAGDQTTINHSGGSAFVSDGSGSTVSIIVRANQTLDITIKPMICTKAAWDISHAFVPYRPSYDELVARVVALENK